MGVVVALVVVFGVVSMVVGEVFVGDNGVVLVVFAAIGGFFVSVVAVIGTNVVTVVFGEAVVVRVVMGTVVLDMVVGAIFVGTAINKVEALVGIEGVVGNFVGRVEFVGRALSDAGENVF